MMKLNRIAYAATLLCLSGAVLAQASTDKPATPAPKLEKIIITGSSVKRLADEKALPIEVLTAAQIQQLGLNSIDEIIDNMAANVSGATNQVTNNAVFGGDGEKTLGGGNFANLRGIGANGTLVLLNGRRVSTHGMSGGSVDLNTIPMDAIERVETLKDGASAIYGTDAIGGVINFITKTSYQGATVRGSYFTPLADGGGQTARMSVTGGFGNLDTQGFNIMASLTVDNNKILRGVDREWATGYQPALGLTPNTSSSVHANIINQAGSALLSTGTTVGTTGDTTRYTNLNLLAVRGQCEDIPNQTPLAANIPVWDLQGFTKANSQYRCGRDYGRNFMLRSPQDSVNGLLKGTFNLGGDHRASVEILASDIKNRGEYAPVQASSGSGTATVNGVTATYDSRLPVNSPYYLDMKTLVNAAQFDPTKPIAYRVNFLNDLGFRIRENETKNLRVQTALEGTVWGLDYSVGAGYGESKGTATLINGFPNMRKLVDLMGSTKYNPFIMPGQTQSAEVVKAFEDMQMRGKIYDGKTSVKQADATISGPLGKFLAGEVQFAVGLNARQETYEFSGSQGFACIDTISAANLATYNNAALTIGCPGNSSSPKLSRDITAAFGELVMNPLKNMEVTMQVRHDRYQSIGGTTNPKIGIKYQPNDMVLLRASANTGFRAPTAQQLKQGILEEALTSQFRDPVLCADINNPVNASQCARVSLLTRRGGNPTLKPEESRQGTAGIVFAPDKSFQASVDYWRVKLSDRIRSLSALDMIANYDLFKDAFVRDPSTGIVQYIQAGWVNSASSRTSGVDFGMTHMFEALDGRFTASVSGTKMISNKEQARENLPFVENVGRWTNTTLYVPWRVNASLSYKTGPWNTTLSAIYRDSYEDENRSPTAQGGLNYTTNPEFMTRRVRAYSTANLVGTYTGIKNLSITASIVNLFDKQPPFTWHYVDNAAGAGWDPRVADPRGRTVGVSFRWTVQ
ncbi:TonB-dependent receptor [Pelomonas sp. V22]|uniref:TonB-dependent receptor domain-containing protein n=1 Tax=Pelomonas sp. V22 TaxID=2822139 RepID=UPI0024A8C88F|nr:TonB-dependent receptor [Pelomonas sp. V22]MDI4634415.1 TonB-dependent receptor [Pelomonas sp. V22]